MQIKTLFGLGAVVPWKSSVESKTGPDNTLLYGLELEIEHASFDWEGQGLYAKEDGSLRNNGVEFITYPMNFDTAVQQLDKFFTYISKKGFDPSYVEHYSERTSIHVHTNCQDLTIEQVQSILLLYQVTENLLFHWIGDDRESNIFCVPWSQTQIKYSALADLSKYVSLSSVERNKYTALNIVPLKELGTIEWRHMAGTCDMTRIELWLRFIGHFYRVARANSYDFIFDMVTNLNTSSQYDGILSWLFHDEAVHLRCPGYRMMLEDGVLGVKYSLIVPPKQKNIKTSDYQDIMRLYDDIAFDRQRAVFNTTEEVSF